MLAALMAVVALLQPSAPARSQVLVDRFLAPDVEPLTSYHAYRHLRASTRGGKFAAEMDVLTSFDPERGFAFEVVSQSGSAIVRRHVLLEALLTEQRTVGGQAKFETALTRANYDFLSATPDDMSSLNVRARRKSPMLVNGTLFLDEDAELLSLDGDLADRPSFWTKHVHVTRRYDHIAGVHVPVAMQSVADIRIVGAATFEMTYRYLEINGQKIEQPRQ